MAVGDTCFDILQLPSQEGVVLLQKLATTEPQLLEITRGRAFPVCHFPVCHPQRVSWARLHVSFFPEPSPLGQFLFGTSPAWCLKEKEMTVTPCKQLKCCGHFCSQGMGKPQEDERASSCHVPGRASLGWWRGCKHFHTRSPPCPDLRSRRGTG